MAYHSNVEWVESTDSGTETFYSISVLHFLPVVTLQIQIYLQALVALQPFAQCKVEQAIGELLN